MLPKGYASNYRQDGVTREDLIKALYKLENKNIGAVRIDSSATNYFDNLLPRSQTKKEILEYSSVNRPEYLDKSEIVTNIRQAATSIVNLMDKEYSSNKAPHRAHQPMNQQDLFEEPIYYSSARTLTSSKGFKKGYETQRSIPSTYYNSQDSPIPAPKTFRQKDEVNPFQTPPKNEKNEQNISNDDLENLYLMYFKKKPVEENNEEENYIEKNDKIDRVFSQVASKRQPVEDRLMRSKTNRDAKLKILAQKNVPTFKPQLHTKTKKTTS